jgi:hypothetical protein
VDEIRMHLVPVLLGAGTRLFGDAGGERIRLEAVEVVETAAATYIRFRVLG